MRKYPLSKKAVAIALATALAVTPFATLSSDFTDSTVYAQDATAEKISNLADRITVIYQNFADEDQVNGDVNSLNDMVDDFSNLGTKWKDVINAGAPGVYTDLNNKIANGGAELHVMLDALVALFEVDPNHSFEDRLEAFHTDYSTEFEAVFEVSVEDFYSALHDLDSHLVSNGVRFEDADKVEDLTFGDLVDIFLDAMDETGNTTLNNMKVTLNNEGYGQDALKASLQALFTESDKVTHADFAEVSAGLLTAAGVNLAYGPEPTDPVTPTDPDPDPVEPPEDTVDDGETDVDEDDTVTIGRDVTTVERTTDEATGITTVRVTVDAGTLADSLEGEADIREVKLSINRGEKEVVDIDVSSSSLKVIKDRNPDARIVIDSNDGSIALSVNQIDTDQLRTSLGGSDDEEVNVRFGMNPSTDDNDVIGSNNLTTKSPVMSFTVNASIGEKNVNLDRFTRPIERSILSANDDFMAGITVVLRLNDDGTVTAVPTKTDGDRATFKGFSNSKYVVVENEATFTDVHDGYWATPYIGKLANQMIFQGYVPGNFRPENATTRAEFAALVTRSLGLTSLGYEGEFTDVDGSEWFADELAVAAEYEIVNGFTDNTFRPEQEVTREEAAAMIVRAMELVDEDYDLNDTLSASTYTDANFISNWAFDYVDYLTKAELLEGNPSGTIRPLDSSKRSEVAAMLERFLVKADFLNK